MHSHMDGRIAAAGDEGVGMTVLAPASRAHIEIIVDSLEELHAEAERDGKLRDLFVHVLCGEGDLVKAIVVIRKRMRERKG